MEEYLLEISIVHPIHIHDEDKDFIVMVGNQIFYSECNIFLVSPDIVYAVYRVRVFQCIIDYWELGTLRREE